MAPIAALPAPRGMKKKMKGNGLSVVVLLLSGFGSLCCCSAAYPRLPSPPVLVMGTMGCGMLPSLLPTAPPLPVRSVRVCSTNSDCPSSPCTTSTCTFGICTTPTALPNGLACDDNNTNTLGDVCWSGKCSGLELTCPTDLVYTPRFGGPALANWPVPRPTYMGAPAALIGSSTPLSWFPVGTSRLNYTASATGPSGLVTATCFFNITVRYPCDTLQCNASTDPCRQSAARCVAGQCVNDPRPDGTTCPGSSTSVCVSGSCTDPCATFNCTASSTTCTVSRCTVVGITPTCAPTPRTDGAYALPANPPTLSVILHSPATTTCAAGQSLCESPLSMLPRQFMMAPPLPPSSAPTCSAAADCPAASQCFEPRVCQAGRCLALVPRALGYVCNDSNSNTLGDSCDGRGVCTGFGITCPSTITMHPPALSVNVWWPVPRPSFFGATVTVTANATPGDLFLVGTTIVTYTASAVSPPPGGSLNASCSFAIIVADPCSGVVCPAGPGECAPTRQCVLGQCVPVPLPTGTPCSSGSCAAGVCRNPCANHTCSSNGTACQQSVCEDQGGLPVCVLRPRTDGIHALVGPSPLPAALAGSPVAQCAAGLDVCSSPLSMLPRAFPSAPPVFPRAPSGGFIFIPTTPSPTIQTTVAPTTTTSAPAVTSTSTMHLDRRALPTCVAGLLAGSATPCECPTGCRACHLSPQPVCTTCALPRALHDGACVSICPAGTAPTSMPGQGLVCTLPTAANAAAAAASLRAGAASFHAPAPRLSLTPMLRMPMLAQPESVPAAAESPARVARQVESPAAPVAPAASVQAQQAVADASAENGDEPEANPEEASEPETNAESQTGAEVEGNEGSVVADTGAEAPATETQDDAQADVKVVTVEDSAADLAESSLVDESDLNADSSSTSSSSIHMPTVLVAAGVAVLVVVIVVVLVLANLPAAAPLLPVHSASASRCVSPDASPSRDSAVGSTDEAESIPFLLDETLSPHYDEREDL
eukprot:m.240341 g.240341  ORF g.240341 m.240341 type:complete len:992 (-) comp23311_c0_seq1:158-3133(-)